MSDGGTDTSPNQPSLIGRGCRFAAFRVMESATRERSPGAVRRDDSRSYMSKQSNDSKALKPAEKLVNASNWKHLARWHGEGYY